MMDVIVLGDVSGTIGISLDGTLSIVTLHAY